jgi:phage tail-like protein
MGLNFGHAAPDANPELAALFAVEIDGIACMAVEKFSHGDMEYATTENRTGIDPPRKRTSSGLQNVPEITIEKKLREGGAPDIKAFYDWWTKGSHDRRSGALIQLDIEGNEILRESFTGAWCKKFKAPDRDAEQESDAPVYVFTLDVETITLETA